MTDLITRLEQAEAGSRELDALITVAVTGGSDPKPDGHYKPRGADFWFEKSRRVSTSVDAITALIGEKLPGWTVMCELVGSYPIRRADMFGPVTEIGTDYDGVPMEIFDQSWGEAKSAPLALCIALLRAIKEGADG